MKIAIIDGGRKRKSKFNFVSIIEKTTKKKKKSNNQDGDPIKCE